MCIRDRIGSLGIGDNFTLINQEGASITTTGRFAVQALNFGTEITTTIINDGTLIAADDTIRLQSGTITNSGLIESTGETGAFGGIVADAISALSFFDVPAPMNFPVAEGALFVTNTDTGVIDGFRTGIIASTGGRVDNDGLITADVAAIFAQGRFDGNDPVDFTVNNNGTLSSEGQNFGNLAEPDENVATLVFASDLDNITVNNSGLIESPDFAINTFSGACLLYSSPSPRDATLSRMPSSA